MKKTLFAAVLMATTLAAQAQWTPTPPQSNDAMDRIREQQRQQQEQHQKQMDDLARMAAAQRDADAQRRAACTRTTYQRDPTTGQTVAVSVPCY